MYVTRNEEGKIIAAWAGEQFDAHEYLEPDDPELIEFMAQFPPWGRP